MRVSPSRSVTRLLETRLLEEVGRGGGGVTTRQEREREREMGNKGLMKIYASGTRGGLWVSWAP